MNGLSPTFEKMLYMLNTEEKIVWIWDYKQAQFEYGLSEFTKFNFKHNHTIYSGITVLAA